ncbi:Major facilitator superfamily domain, general substrate transporter [Penicillium expansum]|nr:Major facilitator superfamily domain, general substrate transporter [Penicillium expansum]
MSEYSHPINTLDALYKKETLTGNAYSSTSDIEKPSPHLPTTADLAPLKIEITYPEGGRDAWLVVLGAWCGLTSSLGIYNTSGMFEVVISKVILPEASSSTLGWIFSVYAFVNWVCGVQIGPTFDAMGPRALMIAGSICTLIGIFTLSVSTEYYQIFLSFSIITGIGSSLLLTPSMGCVAHWFMERRGLASGIAFIGGGFGGVLFPLMIQSLLPQVGWGWSIRILGFVLLVLCAISVVLCRSRIPPRKGAETTWRDTLPDYKVFVDGTGAMALTTAGVLLTDLAYFIPITYMPRYYLDRQHLSDKEALTGSSAFAYQLLAILNAASCVGRYVAGDMADRFGRYNTMIVSLLFCTISVLGFWLPDILAPDLNSYALLYLLGYWQVSPLPEVF